MRKSDKREFLMLAHKYEPRKRSIGGWFLSEKLDGQLCLWDGGLTRNLLVSDVPFSNTVKDKKEFFATGLWTRGGKSVQAPPSWLDKLPNIPLAGELLWSKEGFDRAYCFEKTESVVRRHIAESADWENVKLHVFDSPRYENIFKPGRIKIRDWETTFDENLIKWVHERMKKVPVRSFGDGGFENFVIRSAELHGPNIVIVPQEQLGFSNPAAERRIEERLSEIIALGGEGLILRHPGSVYDPIRSYDYLKIKPEDDAEGVVVGLKSGDKTERGSRHLGRMGALEIEWEGKRFYISGFTDDEREITPAPTAQEWCINNPDTRCPEWISSKHFPVGMIVTFKYTGFTDEGIPRSANYFRKRRV